MAPIIPLREFDLPAMVERLDITDDTAIALLILGAVEGGLDISNCGHLAWSVIERCDLDIPLHHKLCMLAREWDVPWRAYYRIHDIDRPRTWRDDLPHTPPNFLGPITAANWRKLCDYYHNRCLCCGSRNPLTQDHIDPNGERNDIANIQPLCGTCNSRKSNNVLDFRPGGTIEGWFPARRFI